jgi:hypothetical protein
MIFKLRETIKAAFVNLLQQAFATNTDYKWTKDMMRTKVWIPEYWPMQYVKYPCVVVAEVSGGDWLKRTFHYEFQETVRGPVSIDGECVTGDIAEHYGGSFDTTVMINVCDLSREVVKQIADWVVMYIRWLTRDVLAAAGIETTAIRPAGERMEKIGNDTIFIYGLNVTCYSEWYEEIPIAVSETLKGICLEII